MNRKASFILFAVITAASMVAQPFGGGPGMMGGNPPVQNATITKVEGTLALVNGMVAIQTKEKKVFYVMGLQHLLGFVDGLKEGATVKAEGYADSLNLAPEYTMLRLTKVNFNGRDFDLSQIGPGNGGRGRGMGGQGGMMGGQGNNGGNYRYSGRRG